MLMPHPAVPPLTGDDTLFGAGILIFSSTERGRFFRVASQASFGVKIRTMFRWKGDGAPLDDFSTSEKASVDAAERLLGCHIVYLHDT
jgi:hypothetical protein